MSEGFIIGPGELKGCAAAFEYAILDPCDRASITPFAAKMELGELPRHCFLKAEFRMPVIDSDSFSFDGIDEFDGRHGWKMRICEKVGAPHIMAMAEELIGKGAAGELGAYQKSALMNWSSLMQYRLGKAGHVSDEIARMLEPANDLDRKRDWLALAETCLRTHGRILEATGMDILSATVGNASFAHGFEIDWCPDYSSGPAIVVKHVSIIGSHLYSEPDDWREILNAEEFADREFLTDLFMKDAAPAEQMPAPARAQRLKPGM